MVKEWIMFMYKEEAGDSTPELPAAVLEQVSKLKYGELDCDDCVCTRWAAGVPVDDGNMALPKNKKKRDPKTGKKIKELAGSTKKWEHSGNPPQSSSLPV